MSTNQNAFGEAFEKPLTDDFEHATAERERTRRDGLSVEECQKLVDESWAKFAEAKKSIEPFESAYYAALHQLSKAKLRAEIMAEQTTKPTTKEV